MGVLVLRAVCLVRGLEAEDVARMIGLSGTYVRGVWGGGLRPSPRFRKTVAEALALPEETLFRELTEDRLVS